MPKSGGLSNTEIYRGIVLIATKNMNKLILNRTRPMLDQHLRNNQYGFTTGPSTTSHILTLRRLVEEVGSNNLKAVIVFIDFKKAFDGVHRGKMPQTMKAYDIPEKLVKAIGFMHKGSQVKVIIPDGETEFFNILAAVLLGSHLILIYLQLY